jgi:branched-chain amino acid transport system substrate-binding protein
MMAVLLIVGLVIGAGVGYFMAPTKTEVEEKTVEVEVEPLAGKTVKIGNIIASDPGLEWDVPYTDDILIPDMNELADALGYDVTFDLLIDSAQSQAAIHLEKVQSFKAMDVNLVIGGRWSSQASGALSYVNENNILLWSPSSTAPTLRIADDNLFRMCPDDTVQAPAIAEMLWSWGIQAIIVIQRADAWADGIYNILKPEFEEKGGVVAEQIRYQTESREFSSYLASAESKAQELVDEYGADHVGIELICFGEDGGPLLTQVEDYPTLYSLAWFGSDGSAMTQLILDNAPSQVAHVSLPSTYAAPGKSEVFDNLYDRYVSVTGISMGYYSACAYDIMTTLFESVTSAQSTDPEDLTQLQFDVTYGKWGASGWTLLNDAGDRKASNYNIWGFSYIEDEPVFALYGLYDGAAGSVAWYSEAETPDGRALPGLTPPGQ